jgi:hypothetical protein
MRQLADLSLLLGFREFAVATYKLAAQVGAAPGPCGGAPVPSPRRLPQQPWTPPSLTACLLPPPPPRTTPLPPTASGTPAPR